MSIKMAHESRRYRNELQFYLAIGMCALLGVMAMGGVLHATKHGFGQIYVMLLYAIMCVGGVLIFGKMALVTVVTSGGGVHVTNTFSSFDLQWREIDHFDLGPYGRVMSEVCRIHLKNGRIVPAISVQENHIGGGSAVRMVDELNKELAEHAAEPQAAQSL
jgi:hypothetical protein